MAKAKDDFDGMLAFEKLVEYKLQQISRDAAHPLTLDCVSEYKQGRFVPEEKQEALQNRLNAEIDARKRLGDEAYFATQAVGAKIDAYYRALDTLMDRLIDESAIDMPMTWTEFRQRVAREVMEIAPRLWGGENAD